MSTTFYISLVSAEALNSFDSEADIPDPGFKIDFDQFARALKTLWPDVSISLDADGVEWELSDEDGTITGTVENAYMVTVSPGSTRRILAYVNWFRDYVPEQYRLFMFTFGQPDGIEIEGGSRVSEADLRVF